MATPIPKPENLAPLIFLLRGEKVLLSQHLADLYGVTVGALNQAVRRNQARFPDDFMFQLTYQEVRNLKSQIVILKRGSPRALPYAFTEQGVAMLSSVLRSPRAVEVNIAIMRISDEIADIAILLTYLAHDLSIDIDVAVKAKLQANAKKYPVDKARGSNKKYTEL